MTIHVVTAGETLTSIANQYGVSRQRIILDNELPNPDNLVVGQSLGIRFPDVVHTVVQGDTLYSISQQYDVNPNQILQNNPWVAAQEVLIPGEVLAITFSGEEVIDQVIINGYAYPFINRATLRKTLPYLTFLSIFTYGFNPQGDLVTIDDEELIALAKEFGVAPVMMLAPMTEAQEFNSQVAHDMFVNAQGQDRLIDNIIANMKAKGYAGLDIDFEFVLPEDKQLFLEFVTNVQNRLSAQGLFTMVALAPKTSGEMTGLLYEAHDYPTIGAAADRVLLMTYEWGYTYSQPMATAPVNNVRRVLEYGVSVIDPDKILMGIPNYAYDWPLPYVRGETRAESLSNQEAIRIAAANNVTILFDEAGQVPHFNYTNEEGIAHAVWFDDVRSMNSKLRLIPELGLAGGSVWQIMNFFPGLWLVVNSIFTVEKL